MKIVFVAILSGIIGAFLNANTWPTLHAESQSDVLAQAIHRGDCRVSVGTPFIQGGFQCTRGRVMTGLWNGSLYCSDLEVICP
jgi:hypothetical protein